ncbi:MAG TPA: fructosamine kinase family protein [Tepidisphaeraceae bacterium]|nr:fructosamine kinase family protein [Tepidisphaeraceae bacterium]
MSFQESDISWQVLAGIIRDWAGSSAELGEVRRLEGGVINTTLGLTLKSGERAVLKISPHRINRDYQYEAYQLDLLRSLGLPTPQVYRMKIGTLEEPHSLILMQFMDGIDLAQAKTQCSAEQFDDLQRDLAEIILTMHKQTSPEYRRASADNTDSFASWPEFYRKLYDPVVQEACSNRDLPPKARKHISKIHERLDAWLGHNDVPRLVHSDIWATNLLARPDGDGRWRINAVLDPNCKYAHAEAEIAYMDLFHTCTPAFLKAYQQVFKLDEGYHRVRKAVYQLYPLMNHLSLFGNEYAKPMLAALDKVLV